MEPLHIFEPIKKSLDATTWLALVFAIMAFIGMFFLLKRKVERRQRNRYQLGAMLLFFVGLIALSTAFFNFWSSQRIGTLKIYNTSIEINGNTIPFEQLKGSYIHIDQQKSFVNPALVNKSTELLVIEEKNGKTRVLSEEYYDVRAIIGILQPLLNQQKRQ